MTHVMVAFGAAAMIDGFYVLNRLDSVPQYHRINWTERIELRNQTNKQSLFFLVLQVIIIRSDDGSNYPSSPWSWEDMWWQRSCCDLSTSLVVRVEELRSWVTNWWESHRADRFVQLVVVCGSHCPTLTSTKKKNSLLDSHLLFYEGEHGENTVFESEVKVALLVR